MNYASIRTCDIANGEGVRVSLFVSGCNHHCKGCFNEEAQAFDYGSEFTVKTEHELFDALNQSFISGLTILGGEPMEPSNQRALLPFLKRFRMRFGSTKTIWIYTGCVYEKLRGVENRCRCRGEGEQRRLVSVGRSAPDRRECDYPWRCEVTDEMLALTDVLVDGPFVEELKDISLRFRGSSNQRLLHLVNGEVVEEL